MYMTLFAGSPCPKTVCLPRNSDTFLRRPAESRNDCTSNAGILEFPFLGEREALTDTRRAAEDTMRHNSMDLDSVDCSILNSTCRFAQRPWPAVKPQQVLGIQWSTGRTPSRPPEPFAATGALPIPRRS